MNFTQTILLYISTLVAFLGIDAIWLTTVAPKFYQSNIGHLMAEKPNLIAALVFYLLFIGGVLVLVTVPALKEDSIKKLLINGAIFGMLTYATYDLTNLATLKDWPVIVTVVDIIWGTTLSTVTALASYYIAKKLLKIEL